MGKILLNCGWGCRRQHIEQGKRELIGLHLLVCLLVSVLFNTYKCTYEYMFLLVRKHDKNVSHRTNIGKVKLS